MDQRNHERKNKKKTKKQNKKTSNDSETKNYDGEDPWRPTKILEVKKNEMFSGLPNFIPGLREDQERKIIQIPIEDILKYPQKYIGPNIRSPLPGDRRFEDQDPGKTIAKLNYLRKN